MLGCFLAPVRQRKSELGRAGHVASGVSSSVEGMGLVRKCATNKSIWNQNPRLQQPPRRGNPLSTRRRRPGGDRWLYEKKGRRLRFHLKPAGRWAQLGGPLALHGRRTPIFWLLWFVKFVVDRRVRADDARDRGYQETRLRSRPTAMKRSGLGGRVAGKESFWCEMSS